LDRAFIDVPRSETSAPRCSLDQPVSRLVARLDAQAFTQVDVVGRLGLASFKTISDTVRFCQLPTAFWAAQNKPIDQSSSSQALDAERFVGG